MKKYLLSSLLFCVFSSPIVLAEDAAPVPAAMDAMGGMDSMAGMAADATPTPAMDAMAADAAKVDPRETIQAKRLEHQKYMQEQRAKIRDAKSVDERRALIEAQREDMQEYMEEMHELMRAAQEADMKDRESEDMMPPDYYGYGPEVPEWGGMPYGGYMPRMPYGYGPRGWNRSMPPVGDADMTPCPRASTHASHYEEMQQRLDRIESLLEKLQAK